MVDDNNHEVPHGTLGRVVIRVKPYRPVGLFTHYVVRVAAMSGKGDWRYRSDCHIPLHWYLTCLNGHCQSVY